MPTTPAKIDSNRRNALKSTGPRTEAGKLAVSLNATRHGLRSNAPLVQGEDPAEFESFEAATRRELRPVGPLEEALAGRIAAASWRLRRVAGLEAGLLNWHTLKLVASRGREAAARLRELSDPTTPASEKSCRLLDRAYLQARESDLDAKELIDGDDITAARGFAAGGDDLSLLIRYEITIDRGLFRALHELQRLQAARSGQSVPTPAVVEVELTPASELFCQTNPNSA